MSEPQEDPQETQESAAEEFHRPALVAETLRPSIGWHAEIVHSTQRPLGAGDAWGALREATLTLEDYIRGVTDPPPDKATTGNALAQFAFAPPEGRLVGHLSGSNADGIRKLVEGIFQFVRNPTHHALRSAVGFPELIHAIDSVNYAFSVVKRLASETYLDRWLARLEFHTLLKVYHADVDGCGNPERIVTYARSVESGQEGCILVTKVGVDGQMAIVPGKLTSSASLAGDMLPMLRLPAGESVCAITFSDQTEVGLRHELVVFDIDGGRLRAYSGPAEALTSEQFAPEVKDHLGLGVPQLITYQGSSPVLRTFWVPRDGQLEVGGSDEVLALPGFLPAPEGPSR